MMGGRWELGSSATLTGRSVREQSTMRLQGLARRHAASAVSRDTEACTLHPVTGAKGTYFYPTIISIKEAVVRTYQA